MAKNGILQEFMVPVDIREIYDIVDKIKESRDEKLNRECDFNVHVL